MPESPPAKASMKASKTVAEDQPFAEAAEVRTLFRDVLTATPDGRSVHSTERVEVLIHWPAKTGEPPQPSGTEYRIVGDWHVVPRAGTIPAKAWGSAP